MSISYPARLRALALVAGLLAAPAALTAQGGGVSTSRMGAVKSPGVVAAGVVQVEAGVSQGDRDERTRRTFGEVLLRVGVGRDTELRAILPSYQRTVSPTDSVAGLGDAGVAVKHRFRRAAGWRPGLASTLTATLPTGATEVGAGALQPEASVAAEWRVLPRLSLLTQAGHREAVADDDRYGQNTLGAALRANLSQVLATQLEYANVSTTRAGATDRHQLRATLAARLTQDLQLDGWGGRVTQRGVAAEAQFGVGITSRW